MKQRLYISEYLGNTDRGRDIARQIHSLSANPDLNFKVIDIPNTVNSKNEWCRDYMPVKGGDGSLVLFRYFPSYLREAPSNRKTIPDQVKLCDSLGLKYKPCLDIILDGGATEICGQSGIVSDRIFRDNYETWKQDEKGLLHKLQDELKLKKLVVIPQHPYDFTGHVDGLVRFITEKEVLINDLSIEFKMMQSDTNHYRKKLMDQWYYAFKMALHDADLDWEELICIINKPASDAYGIYMNFLLLENLVVVPGFNHDLDETARTQLKDYYKRNAVTILATEIAKKGGIINCVTWVD